MFAIGRGGAEGVGGPLTMMALDSAAEVVAAADRLIEAADLRRNQGGMLTRQIELLSAQR
jgi:fructose-specific phosphotransferase system component IIB